MTEHRFEPGAWRCAACKCLTNDPLRWLPCRPDVPLACDEAEEATGVDWISLNREMGQ